jgi:hypothetical protein
MYFCLRCKVIHDKTKEIDKVFSTGYVLIDDRKIYMGFCQFDEPKENNNEN